MNLEHLMSHLKMLSVACTAGLQLHIFFATLSFPRSPLVVNTFIYLDLSLQNLTMQRSTHLVRLVTSRAAAAAQTPIRNLSLPLSRHRPSTRPTSSVLALSASGQRRWNSSNVPTVEGESPIAIEPKL